MKLEHIVWLDHHESDNAWETPGAEPEAAKYASPGYVIFENDEIVEITLASPLNDVGGANLHSRPLRILKCAIVSRTEITLPTQSCEASSPPGYIVWLKTNYGGTT